MQISCLQPLALSLWCAINPCHQRAFFSLYKRPVMNTKYNARLWELPWCIGQRFRAVPATSSLCSTQNAEGSALYLKWNFLMGNCLRKGFAQKLFNQMLARQLQRHFGLDQMEVSEKSFTLLCFSGDQTVTSGLRRKGRKIHLIFLSPVYFSIVYPEHSFQSKDLCVHSHFCPFLSPLISPCHF